MTQATLFDIRLACEYCENEDGDGVSEIPPGWVDVSETEPDDEDDLLGWYTHLGVCPECESHIEEFRRETAGRLDVPLERVRELF